MAEALMAHILAPNATVYERTLASQVERLLELDTDRIRHLWDPWNCPEADLPYLAWALSVDLWNPNWHETKKRQVIADSLKLHKLKGTQDGIAKHIAVMESTLLRAIVPPARGFYTPAMTDDSRKAWLRDLPQVRIYPFLTRRTAAKKRAFYSRPGMFRSYYKSTDQGDDAYMQASDGPKLYGRQATFFDRGLEVPANYEVFTDPNSSAPAERVYIRKGASKRKFYGHFNFNHGFMQTTEAATNVISVRIDDAANNAFSVEPGALVTDVRPERIYQPRITTKGRGFWGTKRSNRFYNTTFAPHLVYDRVTILDRSRLVDRKKVRTFWGHARYGIKPFSAELLVEVPMQRPKPRYGTFIKGFWKKADMQKLSDTMEAIHVSKSFRDKILVDTVVHRPLRLRDVPKLGQFKLGQLIRVI